MCLRFTRQEVVGLVLQAKNNSLDGRWRFIHKR